MQQIPSGRRTERICENGRILLNPVIEKIEQFKQRNRFAKKDVAVEDILKDTSSTSAKIEPKKHIYIY